MAWDQNFSEARDLFQRAIQTDTTNAIAWNGLALMELQANRLNEALECANQAVEHGTSNFVFLRTRGQIALKLKRWEQVIEDVKKVVAENPGSKIDHAMLAEAYKGIGNQPLSDLHQAQAKH
jgi:predicted Zn-dependent protease